MVHVLATSVLYKQAGNSDVLEAVLKEIVKR